MKTLNGQQRPGQSAGVSMGDRPPPSDHEAEQLLLGSMYHAQDEVADKAAAGLRRSDFSIPENGELFTAMCKLHRDGTPLNDVSIRAHFGDGDFALYGGILIDAIQDTHPLAAAHADYYIGRLADLGRRRRLIYAALGLAATAYDETADLAELHLDLTDDALGNRADRFEIVTAPELAVADCVVEYLIPGWLPAGQPCILAGPKKCLKTNLLIELAVSLATRSMFLGRFPVERAANVLVMSGESGAATIRETFQRIVRAKGWAANAVDRLSFSFDLPQIGSGADLATLRRIIRDRQIDMLVIDPAYLAMGSGADAGNLFAMGDELSGLGDLCRDTGVTVVLAHHTRKAGFGNQYALPELEDIAWSGFQEFARSWFLLNRRERYDPEQPGHHQLWAIAGGSAGHSQAWALDIDEGSIEDDGGRRWDVDVIPASQARGRAAADAEERKEREAEAKKLKTHQRRRRDVLAAFGRFPEGAAKTTIRESANMGGGVFQPILDELIDDGTVVEFQPDGGKQWYRTTKNHTTGQPDF